MLGAVGQRVCQKFVWICSGCLLLQDASAGVILDQFDELVSHVPLLVAHVPRLVRVLGGGGVRPCDGPTLTRGPGHEVNSLLLPLVEVVIDVGDHQRLVNAELLTQNEKVSCLLSLGEP